jgi:hypothetical protein
VLLCHPYPAKRFVDQSNETGKELNRGRRMWTYQYWGKPSLTIALVDKRGTIWSVAGNALPKVVE